MAHRLATAFPTAQVHALVDGDPHGIDILSHYTFGSATNRFSAEHAPLALGPRLRWMGLKPSEWRWRPDTSLNGLLPLSDRDVRLSINMCTRDIPAEWR